MHHQHSRRKYTLAGGRGNAVKLLFRVFFQKKVFWFGMLLSRKSCACTSLSLLLSPSVLSLLTQALRNHWQPPGKDSCKESKVSCLAFAHKPCHAPLLDKSPPWRKAFISSCVRKQGALQLSSGLLGFITSKHINILLMCMHPTWVIETYALQCNSAGSEEVQLGYGSSKHCFSRLQHLLYSPQKITPYIFSR